MKRKALTTTVITLLITACMIPAAIFADSYVAEVNGTKYTDYQKAWNAVKDGGTIKLLSDWMTNDTLKVSKNADVTIRANGHTINRCLAMHKSKSNGTVLSVGENSRVYVYDGTITGGNSNKHAGGIHIKENADLHLCNVTVRGNHARKSGTSGNGGGVMLDGNNTYLHMFNSHIYSNYAEERGAGIYISNYKNCTVELEGDSSISSNKTDYRDGGGIFINGKNAKIFGHLDRNGKPTSKISGNKCDDSGGAIYVNNENCLIKNLEISENTAEQDGGGIYADSEDGTIEACVIKDNKAGITSSSDFPYPEGGGVYIDNDGWTIIDCNVTGNKAEWLGAGVFVTWTVDIAIEGNTIIKDNNLCGGRSYLASDLFLDFMFGKAYIKDPSKIKSAPGSIGIDSGAPIDKRKLSAGSGEFNESIFFSNNPEFVIKWDYDAATGKGDKLLKMREARLFKEEQVAPTEPAEPTEQLDPTEETEATEGGGTEAGSEYSFEITCGCGDVITGEELKALLKEAELNSREIIEQNGGQVPKQSLEQSIEANALGDGEENIMAYVLDDDTTQIGSLEERLSDEILIKCPGCEEVIKIDLTENPEMDEMINALIEEIKAEDSALAGMILGGGGMYAMLAVIIAAAAGSFIVIRRIRKGM